MASAGEPGQDSQQPGDEAWLTTAQAARQLQVSASTIWRWIDAGRLPAFRVGPKTIRFRASDLERLIRPVHDSGASAKGGRAREGSGMEVTDAPRTAPLSEDEVRRQLAVLDRLQEGADRLQAERGGRLMPSSTELVREERDRLSDRG